MQNYGMNNFNPYLHQQRFIGLRMMPVSNIMEANSTPVDSLEPVFFYNKAENVIYKKQIDNTGAAPIQIFKLDNAEHDLNGGKSDLGVSNYEENFKAINERLDALTEMINTENNKGGKR